jgi:hypothetical protein
MSTREARAQARASWPIVGHRLADEPPELLDASPGACVAMVWALTLDAWASTGQPLPTYARAEAPGRMVRGAWPSNE